MIFQRKRYLSLLIWVFSLILIGAIIGNLTKNGVDTWYATLNRSPLTPPNYVFGVVWTILYAMIGISGWSIWNNTTKNLALIKKLYIGQLVLNWSWTPLFFYYHLQGYALICLILIVITVTATMVTTHRTIRMVSLLFAPYLLWLLFATYLNLYIWLYN